MGDLFITMSFTHKVTYYCDVTLLTVVRSVAVNPPRLINYTHTHS